MELTKIAFGGGCYWCTEAVFQSLIGVEKVAQGFISSKGKNDTFSEAVIVYFNKNIDLKTLIKIHLLTHKSTVKHSMRNKYRSAIYYFTKEQEKESQHILTTLQIDLDTQIITQILPFKDFKPSIEASQNYYIKNSQKPFCKKYIHPKLELILREFSSHVKTRNTF
jgi:peptide-methionine (S)-S-oxide reductase